MRELFEVVHQAKQFPLPVHFGFAAQGETVQAFVAAQVSKHRFDGGEALGNHALAKVSVNFKLHLVGVAGGVITLALQESDLPSAGFIGSA